MLVEKYIITENLPKIVLKYRLFFLYFGFGSVLGVGQVEGG